MKRFLRIVQIPIKIVCILAIAFMTFLATKNIFLTHGVNYDPGESFRSLPEDSMDILVLGSSHAQYSFVPSFIYQDTGLYSYILGSACQPFEVSVNMLKEGLKTQSPKMVIMEVYTAMPLRIICEANSSYVIAAYDMTGKERHDTFSYLPKAERDAYYNDYLTNHNNWRDVDDISDLKQHLAIRDEKIDYNFGYVYLDADLQPDNFWIATDPDTDEIATLDERDEEALNEILKICKERNIELLLYKTPIDGNNDENQKYLNAVWKWADDHDIAYIDFFDLQEELDFNMWIHSNSYHAYINGANIITSYISDYLKDELTIFDHHDNSFLEEYYRANSRDLGRSAICYEYNPRHYLRRFGAFDDVILVSFDYEGQAPDWLKEDLYALGVDSSFNFDHDYFAIIKDGTILAQSRYGIDVQMSGHRVELGEVIRIDGTDLDTTSLTLAVLNDDMSVNILKTIDYYPLPWDAYHDYYYHY